MNGREGEEKGVSEAKLTKGRGQKKSHQCLLYPSSDVETVFSVAEKFLKAGFCCWFCQQKVKQASKQAVAIALAMHNYYSEASQSVFGV